MIGAGDVDRGVDVLSKVRKELADEADALRALMSGLRPPVLEERGLMPALRRWSRASGSNMASTPISRAPCRGPCRPISRRSPIGWSRRR